MVSIKEKIASFEAKIVEQDMELQAIKAAFDTYKADAEAKLVEGDKIRGDLEAKVAEALAKVGELEAQAQVAAEQMKAVQAERDELKAKVELIPAEDVGAGQKAVADGSVEAKVDEVDHVKVVNALSGAEKISYYRKHRAEIDAAFKR